MIDNIESNKVLTKISPEEMVSREILMTREFYASCEQVFDAWSEPDKIGKWWGPNGFFTRTKRMEFWPGGSWDFIMHGPDGTDYKNYIVYTEIQKPVKIAYDHGEEEKSPPHFQVTVTFDERKGSRGEVLTRLSMRMVYPTVLERTKAAKFGAIKGGTQTLDRLEQFLA